MIVGHQKQWQFLKKSAQQKKLAHAYLFCGQDKLGKKTVALKWVSLITGHSQEKQDPDLILITPSSSEKDHIQISQIRDLIWKLQLTPYSSSLKAAIIDQAHLMGIEAQHAFLKTLEEPKGNTLLILISEKPDALFLTIRSRCQIIKFYPVPKSEIQNFLRNQEVSKKEVERISAISQGRPGVAIDCLLNPQKLENRKKIIKEFCEILNSPLYLRFQYAKGLAKEENLKEIMGTWIEFLRDSLISNLSFKKENISFLEKKKTLEFLEKINFLLSTTNLNPRLALETFFSQI